MTNTSSRHSSRDPDRSSCSRSPRSEYSNTRSHSGYKIRSHHSGSRESSRSRSGSNRSRSWTRSRSNSRWRRTSYTSRSRSRTRSRSSSFDDNLDNSHGGRRCSYSRSDQSFSRSRSSSHSSRASKSETKTRNKDPRDRSRRVHWPNGVWLVGEKAKDTTFHFCDICDLPIVIYGRLLPCKHVFCYTCALNLTGKCNRCQKSVQNVERCLVGGIFMCFKSDCCRRTYLSQRDLQAHIDHRHRTATGDGNTMAATSAATFNSSSVVITGPAKAIHSIHPAVESSLQKPSVTPQAFPMNPSLPIGTRIMSMPPHSMTIPATSQSPGEFVGKASGLLPLPSKPSQLMQQPMTSTRHRVNLPRAPSSLLPVVSSNFQNFHNKGAIQSTLMAGLPSVRDPPLSTFVDVPPTIPVVSSTSSTAAVSATMTALAMAAAASLSTQSTSVAKQQNRASAQVDLNLSLLSNALRAVDPTWSRANALGTRPSIPGPLAPTGQMLPGQVSGGTTLGSLNSTTGANPLNRFPF